jgi:hypothetical protein
MIYAAGPHADGSTRIYTGVHGISYPQDMHVESKDLKKW